jgi:hypothetical protein
LVGGLLSWQVVRALPPLGGHFGRLSSEQLIIFVSTGAAAALGALLSVRWLGRRAITRIEDERRTTRAAPRPEAPPGDDH